MRRKRNCVSVSLPTVEIALFRSMQPAEYFEDALISLIREKCSRDISQASNFSVI
jgi:hypothetical protein